MGTSGRHDVFWADHFLPVPGLIITSAACCTLIILQEIQWRGSEAFAAYIVNNRTRVAIAVQVVSHLLGLIQVQALCAILRSSWMYGVRSSAFSVHTAQFVNAASTPKLSWALPWYWSTPLVLIVIASFVPAALWSGATTPVLSEKLLSTVIDIPSFATSAVNSIFSGDNATSLTNSTLGTWLTDKGIFSFDPTYSRSVIMNAASNASPSNQSGTIQQKLDKTGYSFANRSFGAGAAPGLVSVLPGSSPLEYWYNETGFRTSVSCFYNSTSDYAFYETVAENLYQAQGETPDGVTAGGWFYYAYETQDMFGWAENYDNVTKSMTLIMTTAATPDSDAWHFAEFNGTQCQMTFEPMQFGVHVNNSDKIIAVTPLETETISWPAWGDQVAHTVTDWFFHFSYLDGMVGGSELGHSVRLNVDQLQQSLQDNSTAVFMRSIEDYLNSCADAILVTLISARLVGQTPDPTTRVSAMVAVPAVIFGGDSWSLYAVTTFNFVVCVIYIFELLRTRAWKNTPDIDIMNLASVILGMQRGEITAGNAQAAEKVRVHSYMAIEGDLEYLENKTNHHLDKVLATKGALTLQFTRPKPRHTHRKPRVVPLAELAADMPEQKGVGEMDEVEEDEPPAVPPKDLLLYDVLPNTSTGTLPAYERSPFEETTRRGWL